MDIFYRCVVILGLIGAFGLGWRMATDPHPSTRGLILLILLAFALGFIVCFLLLRLEILRISEQSIKTINRLAAQLSNKEGGH